MKRLIAFSSVAHMGFVMLGIATLTDFGINAAIFGMVAHGLITGMLFFIAGSMQERYGTREISRLGGLLTQAPQLGWILGFCAMASLGLPGLAGFWGEFPAILSAYDPKLPRPVRRARRHARTFRIYMVIAAIGTVLAAGYLLWMFQRVALGKPKPEFEHAHIHDVHVPEWIAWTPLLAAHRRARHLPAASVPDHRRRGHATRHTACRGRCSVEPARRLPRARAGDRPHGDDRRRAGRRPRLAESGRGSTSSRIASARRARRADPGHHAGGRRHRPRRCSAARSWSTTTRSRSRASSSSSRYVVAADVGRLHRRGRLLPGRVLLPAAHVGARHDRDGVGARPHHRSSSRSRRSRSRRSCSPAGASTTRSRTRRRSSTS